jgi:uncharacterized membrane protein YcaP (DUF421 family)
VPDGLLLILVIVLWATVVNALGYRFRTIDRLVHPPPLPLVEEGRLNRGNLRRELITLEELMTQVRMSGLESLDEVHRAWAEGNGEITVVPTDRAGRRPP